MRKGIALPLGGTMMIVIMAIVLYILHTGGWSDTAYVTYRGEVAMSAAHEVELVRKMLDQGTYFMAQRAAYNVGKNGGGSRVWDSVPTKESVENEIAREIDFMLPSGTVNASYPNREIEWGSSNVVIDHNGYGEEIFHVSGGKTFELIDKNIDLKIISQSPFNQTVESNLFELYGTATQIVSSGHYESLNADELEYSYEYKFEKTIDGNNVNIVMYDDSCVEEIDCTNDDYTWELSCIAPTQSDEPRIILCGDAIPFDYIKFEFSVPLSTTL